MGFGTLTIDVENRSRYIGVSGASAYLNTDFWKSRQNSQENLIHVCAIENALCYTHIILLGYDATGCAGHCKIASEIDAA